MSSLRAVHDPKNKQMPYIVLDGNVHERVTAEEAMFLAIFMNAGVKYEPLRRPVPVQEPKRT